MLVYYTYNRENSLEWFIVTDEISGFVQHKWMGEVKTWSETALRNDVWKHPLNDMLIICLGEINNETT